MHRVGHHRLGRHLAFVGSRVSELCILYLEHPVVRAFTVQYLMGSQDVGNYYKIAVMCETLNKLKINKI